MPSGIAASNSTNQPVHIMRGASYLVIQALGVNMVTILAFVIVARLISTKEMGIYLILQLIIATCSAFFTWFPSAVTKYVAENFSRGSKAAAAGAFYQALRANLIFYIPVVLSIYFGSATLARHLVGDATYTSTFQVFALDVFFSTTAVPLISNAMLGMGMFREVAHVGLIVGGFARQALIISLLILMRGFTGLIVGWAVSDIAQTVIYLAYVVRALGPPTFNFPLGKLFRYYLPLELASIVSYAQYSFDRALLVFFVPLTQLGIYNATLTAFQTLTGVQYSMNNVMLPAYSAIKGDRMNNAISLASRYTSFVITPLAFGLLATARPALTLFVGESYVAGYVPLMILSGAYAVIAFTTPLNAVFLSIEDTRTSASISGATVLLSLVVAYLLLPRWGIDGTATGRAFGIIMGAGLTLYALKRKVQFQLDSRFVGKVFVAGGTMAAVVFAVQLMEASKFLLPFFVLIGALVYFAMLRILKAFNQADLRLIQRFLGKKLTLVSKILNLILLPA